MNKTLLTVAIASLLIIAGCTAPGQVEDEPVDQNSQTFEVKSDLLEQFAVGTTEGMPTVISDEHRQEVINNNTELVEYIKNEYDENQTDTYHKIQQFQNINLTNSGENKYRFTITNGQTCIVETINGTYNAETSDTIVLDRTNKSVPC